MAKALLALIVLLSLSCGSADTETRGTPPDRSDTSAVDFELAQEWYYATPLPDYSSTFMISRLPQGPNEPYTVLVKELWGSYEHTSLALSGTALRASVVALAEIQAPISTRINTSTFPCEDRTVSECLSAVHFLRFHGQP